MKKTLVALTMAGAMASSFVNAADIKSTTEIVSADEINWGWLNKARGDKSPAAADLWGDRTKDQATGFLVRFKNGFSSPEHIHNITYRGVVISGLVHNDDKNADEMWLPEGSFWTQPAGAPHITSANDESNLAYIEIDSGPYLVRPTTEHFDNHEKPINVDKSNIVWLDASDIKWVKQGGKNSGAEVAFLWGEPGGLGGSMVKLPAGFKGEIKGDSDNFRAVVIKGSIDYQKSKSKTKGLGAGSYFGSTGKFEHKIVSTTAKESVVYIRTDGKYVVTSN